MQQANVGGSLKHNFLVDRPKVHSLEKTINGSKTPSINTPDMSSSKIAMNDKVL